MVTTVPCPHSSACLIVAVISAEASASRPCRAKSLTMAEGAKRLPIAAATLSASVMREAAFVKSPIQAIATPNTER
jgi:hypothetical protein